VERACVINFLQCIQSVLHFLLHPDQTSELEKLGISAVYLGSAQTDPNAESKVLGPESNVSIVLVSPEWLFNGKSNYMKIQSLTGAKKLD